MTPSQPDTSTESEDFKRYFEANLLDGDAIQAGQMLASTEVYDVLKDYIATATRKARLDDIAALRKYCQKYTMTDDMSDLANHLIDLIAEIGGLQDDTLNSEDNHDNSA